MKTIKLYGALGKRFGKTHKLDVKNPAEAIRAFCVILKGFKDYMVDDIDSGYQIFVGSEDIYSLNINNPTSNRDIIRIVPIISGAGGGKQTAVAGIILLAIAAYATGGVALGAAPAAGAAPASTAFLSWATVAQLGVVLTVSGISSLMYEDNTLENEEYKNNPNYAFDGVINTTRQGNAVPVGYGKLRIGSQVISAGLTTL